MNIEPEVSKREKIPRSVRRHRWLWGRPPSNPCALAAWNAAKAAPALTTRDQRRRERIAAGESKDRRNLP